MTVDTVTHLPVDMTVTATVRKRCPVVDEVDEGTVTLTWRNVRTTPELHGLAAYLRSYDGVPMTHEDFVVAVSSDLNCHVSSTWTTAGLSVTCAVPR